MDMKKNQKGFVLWFTGFSGAGKTTIADAVYEELREKGCQVERLDGNSMRQFFAGDLGFSREDRDENIKRAAFASRFLSKNGIGVIASFISPYKSEREMVRKMCDNFIEVYVDTPLEVCEKRDEKGLYAKARRGELKNFTGVSDPYEKPENPEIRICGDRKEKIAEAMKEIAFFLKSKNFIREFREVGEKCFGNEKQQEFEKIKNELSKVYSSYEWKLVLIIQRIIKILIPEGTLRRNIFIKFWLWAEKILRVGIFIYGKILELFFIFQNRIALFLPKKKKEINLNSKKIVYVDHSYHKKTKSNDFLLEYLQNNFEVEIVLDESWIGKEYPDLSFIDSSYLGVVFFQLLPPEKVIRRLKNENIIFFPMCDQSEKAGINFWMKCKNFKIINFSAYLNQKLKRWGLETMYIQFFPKPQEFFPGKKNEIFFWQRITDINIKTIAKFFRPGNANIHIHKAIDPWHKFVPPCEKDEKNFHITYSDWFETREEMWEIIKQKGIYVAPRKIEGIGLSFLEAMAMGKAVVALNGPTMNEYIKNNETGYLLNLKKPKEINLSDIERIQKNTYEFMQKGYEKWERDKIKIIDFIKKQ
jgi:adenylyl-sulfate kinase